ncbi:MAG: serine protease [Chitinophagales bacterium]|nr:serine protease [Chitinophagales bacterium]
MNCSEGNSWQNEKNAVALIVVDGNRWCTGALVSTSNGNGTPYLLTADHCLGGWANNNIKHDAISNPDLSHWSFLWHYESPRCTNTIPVTYSSTGATLVANNSNTDFALLSLTENPADDCYITPYYLGWDRSGNAGTGGVGIHHPNGDIKKIATYDISPSNSNCFNLIGKDEKFWKVKWKSTTNGHSVTEGGSSGSPLINSGRRVIGQLYGSGSFCSNPNCSNPSNDVANYGKFSISWTGDGTSDNRRRLNHWLHPVSGPAFSTVNGSYATKINGIVAICLSGVTYTIGNLPVVATVSWSASPTGIVSLSPSGSSCTVTRIGSSNGLVSLQAQITACSGRTYTISKSIYVGTVPPESIIPVAVGSGGTIKPNLVYPFTPIPNMPPIEAGITEYQWEVVTGGSIYGGTQNNLYGQIKTDALLPGQSSKNITVRFRWKGCDWSDWVYYYGRIERLGKDPLEPLALGNFMVSPNPASGEVTIAMQSVETQEKLFSTSILEEKTPPQHIEWIRITDIMGNIKTERNYNMNETFSNDRFNVSLWLSGQYIAHIFDGKEIHQVSFIVKH